MVAEGKKARLKTFFEEYKTITGISLKYNSCGVQLIPENSDKWGLELRIYVDNPEKLPKEVKLFNKRKRHQ
jgi:hypothetical protein